MQKLGHVGSQEKPVISDKAEHFPQAKRVSGLQAGYQQVSATVHAVMVNDCAVLLVPFNLIVQTVVVRVS